MRIGLYGFGTVGSGVYRIARDEKRKLEHFTQESIEIAGIVVRDCKKKRGSSIAQNDISLLTDDFESLLKDPAVDVIVDAMSDRDASIQLIKNALSAKKHVVSASKAAIAECFEQMTRLARRQGVFFLYEAAVAGGIPILRTLRSEMMRNTITKLEGILNGSSNYVLSGMTEGKARESALADALKHGYLEADPTDDLSGADALRKLTILSSIILGKQVALHEIPCIGIEKIEADDIAYMKKKRKVVKLIAHLEVQKRGYAAFVAPAALSEESIFAGINGAQNIVQFTGSHVGDLQLAGPGAGMEPTADAIWGDLLEIASGCASQKSDFPLETEYSLENFSMKQKGLYYVREGSVQKSVFLTASEAEKLSREGKTVIWIGDENAVFQHTKSQ
ncbi:MAG: homoserine dehydrogenase [Peptoniphilaceae bacterium]|nr:homoserine dehydrogenase [Peptoniphilaceae bacterium]MDY5766457.1 homoserine dehydrogenase [Peptoniphilaceae bacterium]